MKEYKTGDEIRFMFKCTVCTGTIIGIEGDGMYTVSFIYNPDDGRAPESVIYTITKENIL